MSTTATTTYHRAPGLHTVSMDGELVMMGQEQGEYYGLREVAAAIWEHLAEPHSLDELCELVAAQYAVTAEECRDDVRTFLGQLSEKHLVVRSG